MGTGLRTLALALALLLVGLQARLWFGDGSIGRVVRLQREVAQQQAKNAELRERNEALAADVRDLKSGGMAALEERARRELGMIGPEERFYQVIQRGD